MKTDFDIVIIGSGAGGAPIAYEMAKAGKSVLVDQGLMVGTYTAGCWTVVYNFAYGVQINSQSTHIASSTSE